MGAFDPQYGPSKADYNDEPKVGEEREPSIVDRVERLRKSVQLFSDFNDRLEEKLATIISPEYSSKSDGSDIAGKADYPRSQIEETLIVLEDQFGYQVGRSHAILDRINL